MLVLSLCSLVGEQGSKLHPAAFVSDWAFVSGQQLPVSLTSTTPSQAVSKDPEAPLHLEPDRSPNSYSSVLTPTHGL